MHNVVVSVHNDSGRIKSVVRRSCKWENLKKYSKTQDTYTLNSLIINDDCALTGTYFRQLPIHELFIDKIVHYNEIRQLLVFRCFNSV